ncbi:trihelix transcription factor ENAP2-like [Henckelia pumila]|uniref:trihelix transcription factor ENAP2-like n=1 Tax=Henckelia pumila TaxID=405737 RepID=UPI003C6E960E
MDDKDKARYSSNAFGAVNNKNFFTKNVNTSPGHPFVEDDDDDNDNEEGNRDSEGEEDDDDNDNNNDNEDVVDGGNGVQRIDPDDYESNEDNDYNGVQKYPKKRKIKTLSSYEFAPRVQKPTHGGRNSPTEWTEKETFILLDVWGDRFLKQGKKSLRSEEWQEVADMVSHESKSERTNTQCRNRLDTLKKKYKKEKMKLGEDEGSNSEWVYYKKMDMLLSSHPQQAGLSCGVDSGEYVFMNPKVYLNRSNGLDEMRDSPGNSESSKGEEHELHNLLPPKKMKTAKYRQSRASVNLLADAILKFSETYERIETSKGQQLVELENMRMEFHKDLELQRRHIFEKTQAEIGKIHRREDEGNENGSG